VGDKLKKLKKEDYETLAEFRYQLRRFERVSENLSRKEGLTGQQYLLLLQLKGYPGRAWATIGELAERLQALHHSVVGLVDRCVERGLIVRKAGAGKPRSVEVHLTQEGERCLEHLAALHRAELAVVKGVFNVPEIDIDELQLGDPR
jgi:DNA-binding MarR family transcriptional regulator